MASYLFYNRFPNNFTEPNFYAEDGDTLAKNIYGLGVIDAILKTFNGYYIWGLYLLADIGAVINNLVFSGEFVNLPKSFALVSYGFFGAIAILPVLLFRNYFKPMALMFIVLLSIYVPLQGSDYAILGIIGNVKFAFIYIAFLLLVYRNIIPENSKKIYIVDLALLICAYTNITVYPMMLFAIIRYLPKIRNKYFYSELLRDRSFQSLMVLGIAMLPQLYVIHHYGIPPLKGYLDSPFNFSRTIEIFVSRSYSYTILFPVNSWMNDFLVVLSAGLMIVLGYIFSGKYRRVYIFGLLTILLGTFLFVIKRTGISASYMGYKSGGPDQFFYPQNWIFGFILSLWVVELVSRVSSWRIRQVVYVFLLACCIFILAPNSGTFGKNHFMSDNVGTIYANSRKLCSGKNGIFNLPIYPSPNLLYYKNTTRGQLCTQSTLNYYPHNESLNLFPAGNNYLAGLGQKNRFTQTFVSTYNKLDGVNIYFSTFQQTVKSPYTFKLMDDHCDKIISSVNVSTKDVADNSFYMITFPSQNNSRNKIYCFSINSIPSRNTDPLAVQLSAPNIYTKGIMKINNKFSDKDVVFGLHYK
ncbi:MAG: hypothetical protein WCI60_00615 [bacterium]